MNKLEVGMIFWGFMSILFLNLTLKDFLLTDKIALICSFIMFAIYSIILLFRRDKNE